MLKINRSNWTREVRRLFPKSTPRRPDCFVPFDGGLMISAGDTVIYVDGADLDRLLGLIPWDDKLDPLRKLMGRRR